MKKVGSGSTSTEYELSIRVDGKQLVNDTITSPISKCNDVKVYTGNPIDNSFTSCYKSGTTTYRNCIDPYELYGLRLITERKRKHDKLLRDAG